MAHSTDTIEKLAGVICLPLPYAQGRLTEAFSLRHFYTLSHLTSPAKYKCYKRTHLWARDMAQCVQTLPQQAPGLEFIPRYKIRVGSALPIAGRQSGGFRGSKASQFSQLVSSRSKERSYLRAVEEDSYAQLPWILPSTQTQGVFSH